MTSLFPPFNRRSSFRKQPYFFEAGRGVNYKSTGGPFPTLDLNFLSGTLDPRITFSRASNATLTDSTGKITYAPNNLLTYSQDYTQSTWNKLAAGGASIPVVTGSYTTAPDGTNTASKVVFVAPVSGDRSYLLQQPTMPTATTVTYVGSLYIKADSAGDVGKVVLFRQVAGGAYTNITLTSSWQRVSSAELYAANNFELGLRPANGSSTGTVTINLWGAQLEAVTYQTTPSTYNATTTAAYYGPRFDYDPVTLAAKGLLIEEARTNLATYSEQFDNAAWSKTNTAVTANATTAPDGTTAADKLTSNAASGGYIAGQSISVTSGTTYTYSVYLKAAELGFAFIVLANSAFTGAGISVNLSTGAVSTSSGSPLNAQSVNSGNGWWRVSFSLAAIATTNGSINVYLSNDGVWANRAGAITVGNGIFVWGAQLEAGAFATSYIPTVAASVARSADIATMTGTNFSSWFNQGPVNLLLQSQTFDNASWVKTGATTTTVTPNSTLAPDGTMTADTITFAGTTASDRIYQDTGTNAVNGTAVTGSIWLRADAPCTILLNVQRSGPADNEFISCNVTTTWQRFVVSHSTTWTGATALRINLNTISTIGSVYAWGAQLEVGSTATTYIPTTTAPAASPPAVGTLIEDAYWNSAFTTSYIYYTTFTMDATTNNIISLTTNSLQSAYRVRVNAVDQADLTISPAVFLANVRAKRAMAFETNNFATAVNGGNVSVDTVGSVPAVILLNFNLFNGGSRTIASIKYYNQRLPNAKLQALTV